MFDVKRTTLLKVKQLLVIIITEMIIGFIIAVYDHLVLHTSGSAGTSEEYFISAFRYEKYRRRPDGDIVGPEFPGIFCE